MNINKKQYKSCLIALLLAVLFCIGTQAALQDGLVAHYAFDGNADDAITNGYNGMVHGATLVEDRFGRNNAAYFFNGVNAYIDFSNTNVRSLQMHSVAFWAKRLFTKTDSCGLFMNGTANSSITIHQYDVHEEVLYRLNNTPDYFATTNHSLSSGVWAFVVCSYNSTNQQVWVNGKLIVTLPNPLTIDTPSGNLAFIGKADADSLFTGSIDDVRVYDHALHAAEILALYELRPIAIVMTTAPTTVAYANSAVAVAGTNENCIGWLWASNAANAQVYSFPATPTWTSPNIALEVGPNLITAYGTDTYSMVASSSVTITRKAATPTGVAASDGTFTNKVALAWLVAPGAESYRVLRAETNDSAVAGTIATAVSNTVCDDTTAVPGVLYYYWLIAQQNGVEGDPSVPDSGYRQLQPAASIAATLGYHTNTVDVSWAAVEGATKYRVYRADSPLTNLASVIASDITDTNYTDATVTPGLVYYYWVQAQSAVAASGWSGATPGYALLAANFADKKMWSMRDTKKYDTLTCKQLPGPWSELLDAGWSIGIANALTHEIVSGPFELVTKNGKLYTYKSATAVITYTQRYNKRKGTYKVKLVYKFLGGMPTKPGFYLQPPAGN